MSLYIVLGNVFNYKRFSTLRHALLLYRSAVRVPLLYIVSFAPQITVKCFTLFGCYHQLTAVISSVLFNSVVILMKQNTSHENWRSLLSRTGGDYSLHYSLGHGRISKFRGTKLFSHAAVATWSRFFSFKIWLSTGDTTSASMLS